MKKARLIQLQSNERGWVPLDVLGISIDFDCRQYGYKTMIQYFDDNTEHFELNSAQGFVRVRLPDAQLNLLANLVCSCYNEDNWAPVRDLEGKFSFRRFGYG